MNRATLTVAVPAVAACAAVALALRAGGPPPAPALAAVGSAPHLPGHAVALGRLAPGSGTLRLDVVLAPAGGSELSALATAVSTPRIAEPRAVPDARAVHGPLRRVRGNARRGAAKPARARPARDRCQPERLIVHVTGTTKRIEHALGVSLLRYRLPGGGVAYANTTAPRLPSDVAAHVSEIVGLDSLAAVERTNIVRARKTATRTRSSRVPATTGAGPQPTATCAQQIATASRNYPNSLVSSADLAQAYDFGDLYQAGNFGQGATVALIEFSSFIPGDIGAFGSCYGITPHVNEVAVDGGPGGPVTFGPGVGDQVEAELDIEAVLGLAPNATIDVFEAPQSSDSSSLDVFSAAVDNPDVQVISTSWGRCEGNAGESLTSAESTLFQQAAAEGKTIVAAAGDYGSEDCYGQTFGAQRTALAVDDPSSQPFVTGVGGTSFASLGPPAVSVVWNDPSPPASAGGGGVSSVHAMPSFQSGAAAGLGVVNQFSSCGNTSANCREVPDVAADAGTPFATYCTEGGRDGCDPGGWTGLGARASRPRSGAPSSRSRTRARPARPSGSASPTRRSTRSPAAPAAHLHSATSPAATTTSASRTASTRPGRATTSRPGSERRSRAPARAPARASSTSSARPQAPCR